MWPRVGDIALWCERGNICTGVNGKAVEEMPNKSCIPQNVVVFDKHHKFRHYIGQNYVE